MLYGGLYKDDSTTNHFVVIVVKIDENAELSLLLLKSLLKSALLNVYSCWGGYKCLLSTC